MNVLIRIGQVLLALAALNGAYGLALYSGLSALGGQSPSWPKVVGSLVSILVYCFIIYFLQLYYEQRTRPQAGGIGGRRFFGIALSGLSVAALIGFAIVALILVLAFFH